MGSNRTDGIAAGTDEKLLATLTRELGRAFDLSTAIGDATLGEAVEERLRKLRTGSPPQWGSQGEITQVASVGSPALDFYYRPHLFPDMDLALRLGHHLQFDLLPRSLPSDSPLRVAAVLESYCHLSGDLLGWHMHRDELFLWIADVSGHGIRAGLAAAVIYLLIREIAPDCEPGEFARRIDQRMLAARNPDDINPLFATGFWLRVGHDGRARYASSGHLSMLIRRRDGGIDPLPSTGPPSGLLRGGSFGEAEFELGRGDTLCLFTDGVTEARDAGGSEFGPDGLAEVLRAARGAPLDEARAVYQAVRNHRATSLLDDDLTFMVIQPA